MLEAGEEELALMTKIVDKMTKDLDLRLYHDATRKGFRPWLHPR